ncbi:MULTISPECIES: helix-turn-helix domain-containing protein [Rhodobacterales]|uniref:helix-turn-helix domain-containing protein n=1 Tax=Rhodobacterales TaxID=204455 RepID=UPI00159335F6|nr:MULTISPECIES: helix-turn-helix domain-containing protein [Rhodobacterales]MCD9147195.1 helix-turn-helix domain-containing protein [Pseudophaeobacter flagellatus]
MASHTPLAGAIERSVEHSEKLTKMAGDFLTSAQVCDLLRIEQAELVERRKTGKLIAVQVDSNWRYPAFQFQDRAVLRGIETVLAAHKGYDSFVVIDILLAPDAVFDGRNLLSVIQDGDDDAVRRYAAQIAGSGFT